MTAFLPIGYKLAFQDRPGEYVITNVIGRGASTIAYAAEYHDGTGNHSMTILDDSYPIMLICGKKLAETVEKIIYKKGITLVEFLDSLEQEYRTENRRTEDILYS